MIEAKIRKGAVKHIETELADYHETRRFIIRAKNEPPSSAHEVSLIALHTRMTEMERIAQAIEYVMERLPAEKKELVKLLYWTRPQLTWGGVALRLCCGSRTAKSWQSEVIFEIAQELGWDY